MQIKNTPHHPSPHKKEEKEKKTTLKFLTLLDIAPKLVHSSFAVRVHFMLICHFKKSDMSTICILSNFASRPKCHTFKPEPHTIQHLVKVFQKYDVMYISLYLGNKKQMFKEMKCSCFYTSKTAIFLVSNPTP